MAVKPKKPLRTDPDESEAPRVRRPKSDEEEEDIDSPRAPRSKGSEEEDESDARRARRSKSEEEEADDEEFGTSDLPAVSDLRPPHEPDPREVENVTDRIFSSVLSRYGWELHDGRFEHVGGGEHRRRR